MEILEIMDSRPLLDKHGLIIELHDLVRVHLRDGAQIGTVKAGNNTEAFVEVLERNVLPFIAADIEVVCGFPGPSLESFTGVLNEVRDERVCQCNKWGGNTHDDQHSLPKWNELIGEYAVNALLALERADPNEWRKQMVKVAALAVAGIEAFDRQANASADFVAANGL